ncbi:hypothetical protein F4819DRAFT_487467 [Hypoxylon fuscum]|nr:hypothetical protein F4819DRAFT_487467 [Hypoxylon fuscum]
MTKTFSPSIILGQSVRAPAPTAIDSLAPTATEKPSSASPTGNVLTPKPAIGSKLPALAPKPAIGSKLSTLAPITRGPLTLAPITGELSTLASITRELPALAPIMGELSTLAPITRKSPAPAPISRELSTLAHITRESSTLTPITRELPTPAPTTRESPAPAPTADERPVSALGMDEPFSPVEERFSTAWSQGQDPPVKSLRNQMHEVLNVYLRVLREEIEEEDKSGFDDNFIT